MTNREEAIARSRDVFLIDRHIAAASGNTPRRVRDRFQALLVKLGLADRLTLVLASFASGKSAPSHVLKRPSLDSSAGGQIAAIQID